MASGLVNGDTLSGVLATTAGVTSNVGSYGITQGSVAATTNYALSYTGADLVVTALPQTNVTNAVRFSLPLGSGAAEGNLPNPVTGTSIGSSSGGAGLNPVKVNVSFVGGNSQVGQPPVASSGSGASAQDGSKENQDTGSCSDGGSKDGQSCSSPTL